MSRASLALALLLCILDAHAPTLPGTAEIAAQAVSSRTARAAAINKALTP